LDPSKKASLIEKIDSHGKNMRKYAKMKSALENSITFGGWWLESSYIPDYLKKLEPFFVKCQEENKIQQTAKKEIILGLGEFWEEGVIGLSEFGHPVCFNPNKKPTLIHLLMRESGLGKEPLKDNKIYDSSWAAFVEGKFDELKEKLKTLLQSTDRVTWLKDKSTTLSPESVATYLSGCASSLVTVDFDTPPTHAQYATVQKILKDKATALGGKEKLLSLLRYIFYRSVNNQEIHINDGMEITKKKPLINSDQAIDTDYDYYLNRALGGEIYNYYFGLMKMVSELTN
jgi:hypothetical protein